MMKEYLCSLSGIQKLSPEEEARLWKEYKEEESVEARQRIIENYQLLVCREAMKYPVQETVMMDLVQEGMVGLMEAAERFNPSLGVAFSLYAVHRVRGRMVDFLKQTHGEMLMGEEEGLELAVGAMVVPDAAFEQTDQRLLEAELDKAVQRLPGKEREVIQNLFLKEQTATETANLLAVSSSYVYRLEKSGIRRLRGILAHVIHDRK